MAPAPRDGVRIRLPVEPPSLEPLVDGDGWLTRIVRPGIYEPLLRIDPDDREGRPLPALATSVEELDGGRLRIHLREAVRFHGGAPFTSDDVVETFAVLRSPEFEGVSLRAGLEGLRRCTAVDGQTVEMEFDGPAVFARRHALTAIPIHPAAGLRAVERSALRAGKGPLHRAPDGTGPWRFEGWSAGRELRLRRHDGYWEAARRPRLASLTYRLVPDLQAALVLLERGELDVVTGLQPDDWARLAPVDGGPAQPTRLAWFDNNYAFIAWNLRRPALADAETRRALAEAVDVEGFVAGPLLGSERRSACVFMPGSEACAGLAPVPFDPESARKRLAAAGWSDGDGDGVLERNGVPLRFVLALPAVSPRFLLLGPWLQAGWKKVGAEVALAPMEWGLLKQRLAAREFDAVALMWSQGDPQTDPFQVWHGSQAARGSNHGGLIDAEVDRLIESGRAEPDGAQRTRTWQALGARLSALQPYLWLTTRPELLAVRPGLEGLGQGPGWGDATRWHWAEGR